MNHVMRLQEIMTSPVETMQRNESAEDAFRRMRADRLHHLVVLDGNQVVGVLSDRDLGSARGASVRAGKTAGELMGAPVVTAEATTTVREAANKLRGRLIGCLPILERGRLVGIVTVSDLLDLIGRGVERPVARTERATLRGRGPRQKEVQPQKALRAKNAQRPRKTSRAQKAQNGRV